jgi:hypothetical protein
VPEANLPIVAPPANEVSKHPAFDVNVVPSLMNAEAAIAEFPPDPTNVLAAIVTVVQVALLQPTDFVPEVTPAKETTPLPTPTAPTVSVPEPLSKTSVLAATVVDPPAAAYRASAPAVPLLPLTVPEAAPCPPPVCCG